MRIRELIKTLIEKDVDDELYVQDGKKMRKVTGAIPRESDTSPRYYTEIMLESEKNEPVADTCPPSVTYINMDTMDPVVEETDSDRNPTPEQAARNYGLTAEQRDLFLAGVYWSREQGETIEGWLEDENKPPYDCILVPDGKIPWGDFKYMEARKEIFSGIPSFQKSVDLLGYTHDTPLREGLTNMWEWARTQPRRDELKFDETEIDKGLHGYWK